MRVKVVEGAMGTKSSQQDLLKGQCDTKGTINLGRSWQRFKPTPSEL